MTRALIASVVLWLATCSGALAQTQLANPASQRCAQEGGTLQIEQRPDGGQFGVCVFTDNRQCEEWALFRVECPVGGLRVTGYITPASRFCAITGGKYDDANKICTLPDGKVCNAEDYWAGSCKRE
jgi:putative hemolysin